MDRRGRIRWAAMRTAVLPECDGYPCNNLPVAEGCDATLGTGLVDDPGAKACGVTGGHRYMVDGQPNLSGTLHCLAKVGTDGDGSERPMEAMIASVSTLNGVGGCNAGFVRKDALLVVTLITDEDGWGSICSPDYAPFFDAAVSVIDTACEQFEPLG